MTSVAGWSKIFCEASLLADELPGLCLAGDSLKPGDCLVEENSLLLVLSDNSTERR